MPNQTEHIFDKIEELFRDALARSFSGKSKDAWPYQSIEDYKSKTGKKFRMTKKQMEEGLTREQAFEELMESLSKKL